MSVPERNGRSAFPLPREVSSPRMTPAGEVTAMCHTDYRLTSRGELPPCPWGWGTQSRPPERVLRVAASTRPRGRCSGGRISSREGGLRRGQVWVCSDLSVCRSSALRRRGVRPEACASAGGMQRSAKWPEECPGPARPFHQLRASACFLELC